MVSDTGAGTPQGSPISPLLANIALHVLDEAWDNGGRRLGTLVRYCDDFVVLCPTRERAEAGPGPGGRDPGTARAATASRQDQDRLSSQGAEGFDFLGFHHRMVKSWKRPGRYYLHKWPSAGHGLDQRPRSVTLTTPSRVELRPGRRRRGPQPRAAGLGRVLPLRQLGGSSTPSTATSTTGWLGWPARSTDSGRQLDRTGSLGLAGEPRDLPVDRHGALLDCACLR